MAYMSSTSVLQQEFLAMAPLFVFRMHRVGPSTGRASKRAAFSFCTKRAENLQDLEACVAE